MKYYITNFGISPISLIWSRASIISGADLVPIRTAPASIKWSCRTQHNYMQPPVCTPDVYPSPVHSLEELHSQILFPVSFYLFLINLSPERPLLINIFYTLYDKPAVLITNLSYLKQYLQIMLILSRQPFGVFE